MHMQPILAQHAPTIRAQESTGDFWSDYAQGKATDTKTGTTIPASFALADGGGAIVVTIPLAGVTFEDIRKVDEMVDDGKGGKRRKRSATLVVSATSDGAVSIPFPSTVYGKSVPLSPKAAINLNIALAPAKG